MTNRAATKTWAGWARVMLGVGTLAWSFGACSDPQSGSPGPGPVDTPGTFDGTSADVVDATPDTTKSDDTDAVESDVVSCKPFVVECAGPLSQRQCSATGDAWLEAKCPTGKGCVDGQCVDQVCTPLASSGECIDAVSHQRCNASGTAEEVVTCGDGTKCHKGICIQSLCKPNTRICKGPSQVYVCDPSGDAWVDGEVCPKGGLCNQGQCLSPCEVNIKDGSYLGCDYWAMDLDNIEESKDATVGVVVSVPAATSASNVKITDNATGAIVANTVVQAGQVQIFSLPGDSGIDGTIRTNKTFHIETTSPVAVHQFNPLNGTGVYTNDASLLLPSNVTGQDYLVMSWPHRNDGTLLRGFVTVIATQPGATNIGFTPTAPVVGGGGISALNAGTPYLFTLQRGEAINFETDGPHGVDLTGSHIKADQKISVIAGHECGNVPLGITACDHMEQQLFPVETWSTHYIADTFKARSPSQVDIFRVMAGANDVTVKTAPPVPGYEEFRLQRGGWIQFSAAESFEVKADGPILVGHYLTGAKYPGAIPNPACVESAVGKPEPLGDPAFTLAAPVKRYLKEYAVLTPSGYLENYLNIVAPTGTTVTIDNLALSVPWQAIPGTGYAIARQPVQPGVHTVVGSKSFGLTAYGYDCNVSYAYPGGLKLQGFEGN